PHRRDGHSLPTRRSSDLDMKKVHSDRTYSLLLRFNDDNHPLAKCPDRIDGEKFIGGLAFVDVDDPAESYHFLSTKKKVADRGKVDRKSTRLNSSHLGISY